MGKGEEGGRTPTDNCISKYLPKILGKLCKIFGYFINILITKRYRFVIISLTYKILKRMEVYKDHISKYDTQLMQLNGCSQLSSVGTGIITK